MSSRVPCVFPEAPQGRASEQAGGLDGEAAGWWHRKGHSHPGGPWPGPSQTLGRKQVCLFASLSQCSAVWEERSRRAVYSACDAGEGGSRASAPSVATVPCHPRTSLSTCLGCWPPGLGVLAAVCTSACTPEAGRESAHRPERAWRLPRGRACSGCVGSASAGT